MARKARSGLAWTTIKIDRTMTYNPDIHHRRSIRLKEYDYSRSGAYFVTVCAWNRECLFGEILDGEMTLNEYGEILRQEWMQTGFVRPGITLDEYIVMPNHFHGILMIDDTVGARRCLALSELKINTEQTDDKFSDPPDRPYDTIGYDRVNNRSIQINCNQTH